MVKIRTSGWLKGDRPRFTKEYCHPLNPGNASLEYSQHIASLFEEASETYKRLAAEGRVAVPSCLLFLEERVRFASSIAHQEECETIANKRVEEDLGFVSAFVWAAGATGEQDATGAKTTEEEADLEDDNNKRWI